MSKGLLGDEGRWQIEFYPIEKVRPMIDLLFATPNLTIGQVSFPEKSQGPPTLCACGDEGGANFYAWREAVPDQVGLVIKFAAEINQVCVDVRDFLCTAFQGWDQCGAELGELQAAELVRTFGPGIKRYFERVMASDKSQQEHRIALCRLAAQDPAVVRGHHDNCEVIKGRYQTLFSSAFVVRAPIRADSILSVQVADRTTLHPTLSLDQFLGRLPRRGNEV
jgi:hypothetical protein